MPAAWEEPRKRAMEKFREGQLRPRLSAESRCKGKPTEPLLTLVWCEDEQHT